MRLLSLLDSKALPFALAGLLVVIYILLNVNYHLRPDEHYALGKVVAKAGRQTASDSALEQQFYRTVIETLESSEMARRAERRCREKRPELRAVPVQMRVTPRHVSGYLIINMLFIGPESRYVNAYRTALLDECSALYESLRDPQYVQELAALARDVTEREWEMKRLDKTLAVFMARQPEAKAESARLIQRLGELRNQLDHLPPSFGEQHPQRLAITQQLQQTEADAKVVTSQVAEAERLTQALADARATHQTLFHLLRRHHAEEDSVGVLTPTCDLIGKATPWWVLRF
jgi:hypothetical protein